jgi:hypothetical protein
MIPKEKAEELVHKFKKYSYYPKTNNDMLFVNELNNNAQQCALIAVDEIINANPHSNPLNTDVYSTMGWWQEVKQEIEKL